MSVEMDNLQKEVSEMNTVVDSAVAFIQGTAAQVRDAAGDRAKSMQLATDLDAKAKALADAIAANTPAQPA
jgi:hypothetical protein